MATENEAVVEIVKRVRRDCNSYPLPNASGEKLKLVREIEAAHRREVSELRERLKEAVDFFDRISEGIKVDKGYLTMCNKWRKALEGAKDAN